MPVEPPINDEGRRYGCYAGEPSPARPGRPIRGDGGDQALTARCSGCAATRNTTRSEVSMSAPGPITRAGGLRGARREPLAATSVAGHPTALLAGRLAGQRGLAPVAAAEAEPVRQRVQQRAGDEEAPDERQAGVEEDHGRVAERHGRPDAE